MEIASPIYHVTVHTIDGKATTFAELGYNGKVLLIVNVASKCGFTVQYRGLQELYASYKDRGLVILGFPCNQFGAQEPGSHAEIKEFCSTNYQITFPLFQKIEVNGPNTHPLYDYLKRMAPGVLNTSAIKWNFTKFLVDGNGNVIERFAPQKKPENLKAAINAALKL